MIKTFDVTTIRKDFPIFQTGIAYLDSANTSQRPHQVTGAMMEYFEKFNSNIHRAAYRIAEEATERYEGTREKVRDFINATSTKEIIYTRGTTEAINLVAYSWGRKNIKQGDMIVLTVLEHHSNIVPWQILAAERGATIEYVDIDERGELLQDQFRALLERSPKLVAFGQVSNALGTINPAMEMVAVTAPRARLTRASTCGRSAATSTRSAATRCWARPAPASCTAAESCWRPWIPSCPAAT